MCLYCDNVLKEVLQKNSDQIPFYFTNLINKNILIKNKKKSQKRIVIRNYLVGKKYQNVYFTRREAQCMVKFLRGYTVNRAAKELKLSPRTIEFYLKNMKKKMKCRTKSELIDMVHASEFMDQVDF